MGSNDETRGQAAQVWPPVIFTFVIIAALFIFVFMAGREPGEAEAPAGTTAGHDGQPGEISLEDFVAALDRLKPQVEYMDIDCPIDGTTLSVPKISSKRGFNRFGGVATDLMSIALGPVPEGTGRPGIEEQDWEQLLVTNPNNGATYHSLDLYNYIWQGRGFDVNPADWDLKVIAPPLAERDQAEWTVDERILMRVLTQRAYGVDSVELGFAALQGAYAANFNTWYGRDVHIPSAAFYALAAAFLREGIAADPSMNETAVAIASMTEGECYRLLGRGDDAAAAFAAVRETSFATSDNEDSRSAMEVLNQVEALNAGQNTALEMAAHEGLRPPPTGWYLLEMLPAINGHIDQHRAEWASLDDPDEIIAKMFELIP